MQKFRSSRTLSVELPVGALPQAIRATWRAIGDLAARVAAAQLREEAEALQAAER